MERQEIILDAGEVIGATNTAPMFEVVPLIISHHTGVHYTVQAGGMACQHPTCEGFVIAVPDVFSSFDDCSYGCENLPNMPERMLDLAQALDKHLMEATETGALKLRFDYSRLSQLMEGWWPVKVSGMFYNNPVSWTGFLCCGNCD